MDGAANAAGVTPREVSYHTDGSLSSVEGPRPRGGAARVAARGPCAPCGFPGGPHGGPRPRQPTPHPAPLASPRRSGFVTPRPPSRAGKGGGMGRSAPRANRRGRWCVVGHSFGSAAVLTAAHAPRLRGARGRLRPRRPEGPDFKSPPESNLSRLNPPGLRDHPAWHHGGVENKRPQRPHPPEGSASPRRPGRPPSDDGPALGGRARRRRVREAAAPMAQRARRGPPDVGGPTGQRPGPQAVTRRSDARPQAMAPGPHPST